MAAHCAFCGSSGKLTGEHLWPAWLQSGRSPRRSSGLVTRRRVFTDIAEDQGFEQELTARLAARGINLTLRPEPSPN